MVCLAGFECSDMALLWCSAQGFYWGLSVSWRMQSLFWLFHSDDNIFLINYYNKLLKTYCQCNVALLILLHRLCSLCKGKNALLIFQHTYQ